MGIKGIKTTADYLNWNDMLVLVQKLENDKKYKMALFIVIGSYTGLRVSDILTLKWKQLFNDEVLQLVEKKTKKHRNIKLNKSLIDIVKRIYTKIGAVNENSFVFVNRFNTGAITPQYINPKLKEIKLKYRIKINHFSTHSLRKCFGRHVWEMSNYSDKSITMLSEIFNHSNCQITRKYLGINQDEIYEVYDLL